MKYFVLAWAVLLSGCASGWVRNGMADYNHVNPTYTQATFSTLLPTPHDPVCLNIQGAHPDRLVDTLNKGSFLLNYKECTDHAITLRFEPLGPGSQALPSASGNRLRNALAKTSFGGSFWGFLLLSSVEITGNSPGPMRLTILVDGVQKQTTDFSATWWDEDKQEDQYYSQQEILDHVASEIRKSLEPTLQETHYTLHFKTPQPYFDDVIWIINSSQYEQGLKDTQKLALEHPGDSEPFFNIGVLMEYLRYYEEALKNYQTALSLPRGDTPEAKDAVHRLEDQIAYIKKAQPLLPKYRFSDTLKTDDHVTQK